MEESMKQINKLLAKYLEDSNLINENAFKKLLNDIYFYVLNSKTKNYRSITSSLSRNSLKTAVQLEIIGSSSRTSVSTELKIKSLEVAGLIYEYLAFFEKKKDLNQLIGGTRYLLRAAICYQLSDGEAKAQVLARKITYKIDLYYKSLESNKDINSFIVYLFALILNRDFKKIVSLRTDTIISQIYNRVLKRDISDIIKRVFLPDYNEEQFYIYFRKSCLNFSNYMLTGKKKYYLIYLKALDIAGKYSMHLNAKSKWLIDRFKSVTTGISQNSIWNNLDLDKEYLQSLANNRIFELWKTQKEAVKKGYLDSNTKTSILSIPTSSGKTLLAEWFIYKRLSTNNFSKAIYIVPTNALANQVEITLGERFNSLGLNVTSTLGGFDFDELEMSMLSRFRVVVITPEKLQLLIRRHPQFIEELKVVVIDEFHKIYEGQRGQILEQSIVSLEYMAEQEIHYCLISGMLSGEDKLVNWLSNKDTFSSYSSQWRPTRQRFVSCEFDLRIGSRIAIPRNNRQRNERFFVPGHLYYHDDTFIDGNVSRYLRKIPYITRAKIAFGRWGKIESTQIDYAIDIAKKITSIGDTTLIYLEKPQMVREFCKKIDYVPKNKSDNLSELRSKIIEHFGNEHPMLEYLDKKVIYHYGNLPKDIRIAIEKAVRERRIEIIASTSTLLEGVDLPISNLIISSGFKYDKELDEIQVLNLSEFRNLAGRAGRALKETDGLVIFVEPVCNRNLLKRSKILSPSRLANNFLGLTDEEEKELLRIRSTLEFISDQLNSDDQSLDQIYIEQLLTLLMFLKMKKNLESEEDFEILINKTLFGSVSNGDQKETFKQHLINLYSEKIIGIPERTLETFVSTGFGITECEYIKGKVVNKLEEDVNFFSHLDISESSPFIAFLVELLRGLPTYNAKLLPNSNEKIISLWLSGYTFWQIYEEVFANNSRVDLEKDLTTIVDYLNHTITYLGPWVTGAIHYILKEVVEQNEDIVVDTAYSSFPSFLKLGINTISMAFGLIIGLSRNVSRILGQNFNSNLNREIINTDFNHYIEWLISLEYIDLINMGLSIGEVRTYLTSTAKLFKTRYTVEQDLSFFVAGLKYYSFNEIDSKIEVGDILYLKKDKANKYDSNAIEIIYEDKRIGYVPRTFSAQINRLLNRNDKILVRVMSFNQHGPIYERVKVGVTMYNEKKS